MPRRSHHTDSLLKPNSAQALAKGTPLSVRIALGSPKSLKALEHGKRVAFLRRCQGIAADQVTACEVGDRERIAVALVGEHELAFVIGTPQIVRLARLGQRRSLRLVATTPSTPFDEAVPIEHSMDRANRQQLHVGMQSPELLADLGCAPARPFLLQLHNQLLDLKWQLVGVPIRPATAIGEAFEPAVLVAIKDLVAGFTRDIELSAQLRHLLSIEQPRHEPKPLVHLGTLLPRHFAIPRKGQKCYLCVRNEVLPLCRVAQQILTSFRHSWVSDIPKTFPKPHRQTSARRRIEVM